jgi:acyl-homoserine lactone acylase PvdQ
MVFSHSKGSHPFKKNKNMSSGTVLRRCILVVALVVFGEAGTVDVIHDDWGVPHIFASDRG